MANKYTATPIPPKDEIERLYFDEMKTQKEVGKVFGVSQKVVFGWFRKLGIQARKAYKRDQRGPKNSSWKGDDATYSAFHYRVESARGKPNFCTACGDMDAKFFEWCNLTGRYEDVMDYARMCRKCHRKYDKNRPNSSKHVKRKA